MMTTTTAISTSVNPRSGASGRLLDSKVADINNVSAGGFGGAITAALYLQEFVPDDVPWAHFDMMAWNNTSRPGRPEGGEAQAARAIFRTIEKRFVDTD
jgi:leucyl aminopeptidase